MLVQRRTVIMAMLTIMLSAPSAMAQIIGGKTTDPNPAQTRQSFATQQTKSASQTATSSKWADAPLACLPQRAVRWDAPNTMEPCHCPPQSMCPTALKIEPKYVLISVALSINGSNYPVYTISAEDLGYTKEKALNLLTTPTMDGRFDARLQDIVAADIRDKAEAIYRPESPHGVNSTTPRPVVTKDNMTQYYINMLAYYQVANRHGPFWTNRNYDITLSPDMPGIEAYANDELDMPLLLANQCCEALCPEGMHTKAVTQTIQIPDTTAIANLQNQLDNAQKDYAKKLLKAGCSVDNPDCVPKGPFKEAALDAKDKVEDLNGKLENPPTHSETRDSITCATGQHFSDYREGCILEGTLVRLADGSSRPIESLSVGDKVLGHKGAVTIKALNRFSQQHDVVYGFNGQPAFLSPEHPILTTRGWKAVDPSITSVKSDLGVVGKLVTGDEIVTADGTVKIDTIDRHEINDGANVINMSVDGDGTFIAADSIVHGFNKVQIHY